MKSELSPGETLYCFQNQSLIIYFERKYNAELNHFFKSNFRQLVEISKSENIDFCYLPLLLQDEEYQSVVSYNHPYLKTKVKDIEIQRIYDFLISKQAGEMPENGLLLLSETIDDRRTITIMSGTDNYLIDLFRKAVAHFANEIQHNNYSGIKHFKSDSDVASEPENEYNQYSADEPKISKADDHFESDAFILADEIRERIQKLKEYGSLSLISDIIEEINNATHKLSSICITSDYRIILNDYGMREVEMSPLPKSVFLLFLRYPEGILFKELIDYYDELLTIYRNITKYDDIERAQESIRALTDPLNGSINEKCSRIRTAFLEVITDKLARNYYITGRRGEPKKIKLDRKLVEFK